MPLSKSFFLFGARGTGKSTLLQRHFQQQPRVIWVDLLQPELEDRLLKDPSQLRAMVPEAGTAPQWVVIDEVQKVPPLLSIVHQLIRDRRCRFALTGSSARKLKRGGADMLAGRALLCELFSLTSRELGGEFSLEDVLHWGTLPDVVLALPEDRPRILRSYATTYVREEIVQEQIVRKVVPFRRFLESAALLSGRIINYSHFARDVGVEVLTIQSYYEILQDTLLGFALEPFHRSVRKRQRKNPKFFFFDLGVARALAMTLEARLIPGTSAYGVAFEHFVVLEILRMARTLEKDWRFSYLETKDGAEIDLIIEQGRRIVAIEIKSATQVNAVAVRRFAQLARDLPGAVLRYVSQDVIPQHIDNVECVPWNTLLEELFA